MIPLNSPAFIGNEKLYLNECIDSGWISSEGPFVDRFEKHFSAYIGMAYGIAVSSGSGALDIAIQALGFKSPDEIIVPTFTIISPVFSIVKSGAIPVFVDSDPFTWNIDVHEIEKKITSNTKAILVVHTYGLPVNMEAIENLAIKYNLLIIEDAAEMHGQTFKGAKCGSFGNISIFSFYANKNINTGEGGMILCNSLELRDKCKKLRNLSFEPDKPRFVHYESGWNYRMTNLQAAVGVAQLEVIEKTLKRKLEIGIYYQTELEFLNKYGYQLPLSSTSYSTNNYWVFGLVCPDEREKNKLVILLNRHQIGFRSFFWCMHEQPVFRTLFLSAGYSFPIAENLARCGIYLPGGVGLTHLDQEFICKTLKNYYE